MKYIITALICLMQLSLFAQKLSEVQWSDWISINDRNENKVLFSCGYAKFGPPNEVNEKRTGFKWYFRIKNDYNENISGRFVYEYSSSDEQEHKSSYIIHCMPGKTITSNELLYVTNAEKLINIYFVEFRPCISNSSLMAFTIKDTAFFSLQDAMIAQQRLRLQNAGNATTQGAGNDYSDRTIVYKGKNETIIRKLLSTVKGWRTNSGLQVQDGIPPEVPIDKNCQKDQYIYSAILYAWAAESYYRLNEINKAEEVSDKIPALINLLKQICSSNPNSRNMDCKTASIFPCYELNNQVLTAVTQSSNNSMGSRPVTSNNMDMQKEKGLLYSLLPLATTGLNPQNADFTNAFSGLMNKLDNYASEDSTLDTGTKIFVKLAAFHTMSQLRELSGDNTGYANFLQKMGNSISSVGSRFNQNYATPTYSMNKPLSQMSTSEMKAAFEPLLNTVGTLLDAGADENGLHENQKNKITAKYEAERLQNKDLKAKYGYDLEDLKYSIRNFDDQLLDKILSAGFPIDLQMHFSERNESAEQAFDFAYEHFAQKIKPKAIHYAAKYGNVYALKKLIEKGGDYNEMGYFHDMYGLSFSGAEFVIEGGNPLFIAIVFNRYDAAKFLCDTMGNPFYKNSLRKMLLNVARAWKNDEMVDLINSYAK